MERRESVGVVITVEIDGIVYALLQERGELDLEKLPSQLRQSWPGICQVSAHGSLKPGEDVWDGLYREVEEELGPHVAGAVIALNLAVPELAPKLVVESERSEEHVRTYTIQLPWQLVAKIPRGSSGLRLLNGKDAASIGHADDLVDGKHFGPATSNRATTWMFTDERQAVQIALGVSPTA